MSLQEIFLVRPSAIYNALSYVIKNSDNPGLSACAVPGTTIYFDASGDTTLPSPSVFAPNTTIDCRCLTFFANLFAGIFETIVTVQVSSTNIIQTSAVNTVNISIFSPGDISNVNIRNDQKIASKITLINLTDPSTLNGLANISLKAIRSIVQQAATSPVFDDPISRQIVQVYADYLKSVPEDPQPSANPLNFMTIQTANMITANAGNTYNLQISDSTWRNLNININQEIIQEIQLENIVRGITFRFADQVLGQNLQKVMDLISSACPLRGPTVATATPPPPVPQTMTEAPRKRRLLVILLPILGIVVLVVVIVLCLVLKRP